MARSEHKGNDTRHVSHPSQKQVLKNAEEFQMESRRLWQAMFNQEIIPQGLNASLISKIFSSIIEKYKGRFKDPEGFLGPRQNCEGRKYMGGGRSAPISLRWQRRR